MGEVDPEPNRGGDRKSEAIKDQGNNVTWFPIVEIASTYTLKRLKRDRADLFDRAIAGELSANAAATRQVDCRCRPGVPRRGNE